VSVEPYERPSPRGEVRYGAELARLLVDRRFLFPRRQGAAQPVLLVPGFLAGDASLAPLAGWLRRRGHRVATAGIRVNADCAERTVARLDTRLHELASASGGPVTLIGQSRGGELARSLAVRSPDIVRTLVMLGAPVLDPLAVGAGVLRTVRSVARLGDLGVPRVLASECGDGACCARFRSELTAPLPHGTTAVAVYTRSDGIVDWRACLDPYARQVEVESSHCGMAVNPGVYRVLASVLAEPEEE